MQAKRVGKVIVKVQCLDSNYENISDEITLYIQERFDVWPSTVQHIIAGSTFQYYLMTPSGHNISLPASHYSIEVSNSFYTISDTLLLKSPRNSDDSTGLIISDTRTKPHFKNRVEIFSYQPDEILVTLDRDMLITGESVAHYKISFLHQGRKLEGNVDPDKVFVSLVESEEISEVNLKDAFELNKGKETIVSSLQSECYLMV